MKSKIAVRSPDLVGQGYRFEELAFQGGEEAEISVFARRNTSRG
jgi:hypothetical protein